MEKNITRAFKELRPTLLEKFIMFPKFIESMPVYPEDLNV